MAAVVRGVRGEARVGGALGGGRRSRIRYHQGPRPQGRGARAFAGPRYGQRCGGLTMASAAQRYQGADPGASTVSSLLGCSRSFLAPFRGPPGRSRPHLRSARIDCPLPRGRDPFVAALFAVNRHARVCGAGRHRKRRDSNARTATAAVGGTRTTTGSCSATVVRSSRRGRSGWGSWSTSSAGVPATSLRPRARPTRSARSRRPTLTSTTRPLPRTTTTSTASSRRSPCRPGPSGPGSASRGSASST
ncbi:hypothetical protein MBT84_08730 [Streptomyces sp. MBT84]|nr:hypothetical protein [Streptomyces sp. MBT84]